ncbi:MAG: SPOR domain-containing protein [Zoogloeaceae bacterium]|mgnify:CR=1 FL=1|nr:SPOR domain-containing protein [Zoogloeaceae bacterium]
MRIGPDRSAGADTPRAALLRAAVAAVLMVGLLAFMLATDETADAPASPPPQPVQPEPAIVPSPPPPPVRTEAETQQAEPMPPSEPVASEPQVIAPPPAPVVIDPPPAPPAPAPKSPSPPSPRPAVAAPSSGLSHMVVLDDFGPLPAAQNLLGGAATAGYAGRMLQRVQVGPFASREAARKAVESGTRGIVIESGGSWWIQAGVFSDADNAERQRAALARSGRQVVVYGRAEIGPFTSRSAADSALAEVRGALGRPLRQASVVEVR